MPPLRSSRASKACDLCRKYKTRCYASDSSKGACLRCRTLRQTCSLESYNVYRRSRSPAGHSTGRGTAVVPENSGRQTSLEERLERLERTVGSLVDRLDSRLDDLVDPLRETRDLPKSVESGSEPVPDVDPAPAPVILIRDAAEDAGVHSPEQSTNPVSRSDVISTGLITTSTARSLLALFHVHYGRWVRFPEEVPTEILLLQVKKSPLLLSSVFLIAVRHTTQDLADKLAPKLFEEAKSLIAPSLLEAPQSIEFFQAALILSLWSTTVGQVPLSIDSWLVTGYAIQQALASPYFKEVLRPASALIPPNSLHIDAWCLWNHLCVAHLQYCVGMRRQALLNQAQIDRSLHLIQFDRITNYETRMVAEVHLYWIIYNKCSGLPIKLSETKLALQDWQRQWASLFDEPRSQFLQMGFHFAHLLANYQSLKTPKSVIHSSVLLEMIRLSEAIINLAIDTTDEHTRHLTDHIYHIVTFAALTLCKIVRTYESKLSTEGCDIASLDSLVYKLIDWLRSIGLAGHAAHLLGDIVSSQFSRLRPNFRSKSTTLAASYPPAGDDSVSFFADEELSLPPDISFQYPNFIGPELFDIDAGIDSWPQWGQIQSDTDTSG